MKHAMPLLLLASLGIALSGGILVLVNGLSTTPVMLLLVGFSAAGGIVARMGGMGKLGGMDEREVSAAIRERAQKNLETARGKNP